MITIVSKDLKENTTKKYTQVSCSEAWGFYILCLFVEKARGKIVYHIAPQPVPGKAFI